MPTDATALSHTVGLFKSSFSTSAMRRFAVLRAEARGREDGATMALEPSASDRPAMSRVKVAVCVQPLDAAEGDIAASDSSRPSASGCAVQALGSGRLAVSDARTWNTEEFAFDHVYGAFERTKGGVDMTADAAAHRHTRARLFADVGVPALDAAWRGHNVGVFAVGHSGAGARNAMLGDDASLHAHDTSRVLNGLLPRFIDALFGRVEKEREMNTGAVTRIDASFVEVRGDRARDLCAHETGSANIVNTTGPVRVRVDSKEKMHRLLRSALEQRFGAGARGATEASTDEPADDFASRDAPNETGSPVTSHFVARVTLTRFLRSVPAKTLAATRAGALEAARDAPLVSEATLVELCGFERARADDSLKELVEAVSSAAAASLHREKRDDTKPTPAPARVTREAPLLRLARRCLGGDAMTWVVAAVSPRDADVDATRATLRFASTFRNVRCVSRRNVDSDAERFVEAESEARAVAGEVERLAKALAAARARRVSSAPKRAAASFGRRATFEDPAGAESEEDETNRLRLSLRDARAAQDAVERRRKAARAKWTAKLERYAAGRGPPSRRAAGVAEALEGVGSSVRARSELESHFGTGPERPRSAAPATLTPLRRVVGVDDETAKTRSIDGAVYRSDPPPLPTVTVPNEPGARVFLGTDRDAVDVLVAGFGVRPTHAVVLRDETSGSVFVAACDGDPEADVWVNGARVPSLADARASGTPLNPLRDGDRVVVGARSGAAYLFRDPNVAPALFSATKHSVPAIDRETFETFETVEARETSAPRDRVSTFLANESSPARGRVGVEPTKLDPWLDARLELKPLAATLARALAGVPSPPPLDHKEAFGGSPVPERERRRRWREASRLNLARVLPDVDEFNARCRAMGVQARVAPAWDAVGDETAFGDENGDAPFSSARSRSFAEGASVVVVARVTRGLSARAVVELEASAIDDVTNVAATWSATDFSRTRFLKLRAFHEERERSSREDETRRRVENGDENENENGDEIAFDDGELSPSWEEEERDPFLTFFSDGSVALRFADVAPGATDNRSTKAGSASRPRTPASIPRGSRPTSSTTSTPAKTPNSAMARPGRQKSGGEKTRDEDDVSGGSESELSDAEDERAPVARLRLDGEKKTRDVSETAFARDGPASRASAKKKKEKASLGVTNDEDEDVYINQSPRPLEAKTSDPETVAGLFRALAAERGAIASLEKRLDDAEGKARAADVAATRAEARRVSAEERLLFEKTAAEARVLEVQSLLESLTEKHAAELALERTRVSASEKDAEALRAKIISLEGDLLESRRPTPAEDHMATPGLAPFAFPLVPPALLKEVPGENEKKTAEKLRELIREFGRAARAADVTLEYAKGVVDRVRAECAAARADKADEIARRVAIEYALEAKNAMIASLRERVEKAERTSEAMAVSAARAVAASPQAELAKKKRVFLSTETAFVGDRFAGTAASPGSPGTGTDPRDLDPRKGTHATTGIHPRSRGPRGPVPALNLSAVPKFADDAENAPPDWAKRATPLLRMVPAGLDSRSAARREGDPSRHAFASFSPRKEEETEAESPSRVSVPAALRDLTDLAMSLPLSARQSEAAGEGPPATPPDTRSPPRSDPPPRGEVASRVKAKLGGRERLQQRGGSAAKLTLPVENSPGPGPGPAFSPPRGTPSGARGVDVADVDVFPREDDHPLDEDGGSSVSAGFEFSPPLPLERGRPRTSLETSPAASPAASPAGSPAGSPAAREWWETDLAGNDTKTPSPFRESRAHHSPSLPVPVPVPPRWRSPEAATAFGGANAVSREAAAEKRAATETLPRAFGSDGESDARVDSSRGAPESRTPPTEGAPGNASPETRASPEARLSARLSPPATPEDVGAFGAVSQEERRAWWAKRQMRGAVAKIGAVRAFKAGRVRRGTTLRDDA